MGTSLHRQISPERAAQHLREYGYAIVENAAELKLVRSLDEELRHHLDASVPTAADINDILTPEQRRSFGAAGADYMKSQKSKRLLGLIARCPSYQSLVLNELLLGVADQILLPNCMNYCISSTNALEIGPGTPSQPYHQDDSLFPVTRPHPEFLLSSLWAIDDFTEENGATKVISGSNHWPGSRMPQDEAPILAIMPKGSVLLWLGSTWHAGGANRTPDQRRLGVYVGFSLGWLRQRENQYLSVSRDLARKLPEKLARLMGYQTHGAFLGMVSIDQGPYEFLHGES